MRKWWTKAEEVIEELGWSPMGYEYDDNWCISIDSPEGQDCNIEVEAETFSELAEKVESFVESYDVSSEAYLWLDNSGHGINGAPYDMKDVYEDMEWFEKKASELADALKNAAWEYENGD